MCCSDKQERITSFIDGELSTRDQIELFKHLAICPDCQSFIDVIMRMRDIQKREQINYPVEIDETLLSRLGSLRRTLNSESPRTTPVRSTLLKHRVSLPVPLAIGAAAAAIIIGFLLNGIFYREAGPSTVPVNFPQQYAQPTAVIFYYGMPPVEVTSTAMIQTKSDNKQRIY